VGFGGSARKVPAPYLYTRTLCCGKSIGGGRKTEGGEGVSRDFGASDSEK